MSKSINVRTPYSLIGSDFSQQEPRLTTAMSGCKEWVEAYSQGKDLYATIGTGAFKNTYWENMEHNEDGSPNVEGKKRRSKCKVLLLGITYGMGSKSIATKLGVSKEEAEAILEDFYTGFPRIKEWVEENEQSARKYGYVEDFWGRRRRIPDAVLPEYEIKYKNKSFNPFLYLTESSKKVEEKVMNDLLSRLKNCRSNKDRDSVKKYADSLGIEIKDNTGFISRGMRQATNAKIQGSAATMTKKAMINIYNDEELKSYDFKMLIGVHDEIIGECKSEFAREAGERLAYLMRSCVPEVDVPFKCDAEIENEDYSFRSRWYGNEYSHIILDEYKKMLTSGMNEEDAMNKLKSNHYEMLESELNEIIEKG